MGTSEPDTDWDMIREVARDLAWQHESPSTLASVARWVDHLPIDTLRAMEQALGQDVWNPPMAKWMDRDRDIGRDAMGQREWTAIQRMNQRIRKLSAASSSSSASTLGTTGDVLLEWLFVLGSSTADVERMRHLLTQQLQWQHDATRLPKLHAEMLQLVTDVLERANQQPEIQARRKAVEQQTVRVYSSDGREQEVHGDDLRVSDTVFLQHIMRWGEQLASGEIHLEESDDKTVEDVVELLLERAECLWSEAQDIWMPVSKNAPGLRKRAATAPRTPNSGRDPDPDPDPDAGDRKRAADEEEEEGEEEEEEAEQEPRRRTTCQTRAAELIGTYTGRGVIGLGSLLWSMTKWAFGIRVAQVAATDPQLL